jgi:hypothetical protein
MFRCVINSRQIAGLTADALIEIMGRLDLHAQSLRRELLLRRR